MSLTTHAEWANVAPWLRIETYDRDGGHAHPRHRIEVARFEDPKLERFLLALTMPCVVCGRAIHPIRVREGRAGLFVAVTCELRTRFGCARSREASEEYRRIINALVREGYRAMLAK